MATFSKLTLSGSTDGRGILLTGNSSGTANTIHTGSTTATTFDEIWLYAMNTDASPRKLTIEWGSNTSPNDLIEINIAGESGLVLIVPGLVLKGNATALVVKAFPSVANLVTIHGYVNRIA